MNGSTKTTFFTNWPQKLHPHLGCGHHWSPRPSRPQLLRFGRHLQAQHRLAWHVPNTKFQLGCVTIQGTLPRHLQLVAVFTDSRRDLVRTQPPGGYLHATDRLRLHQPDIVAHLVWRPHPATSVDTVGDFLQGLLAGLSNLAVDFSYPLEKLEGILRLPVRRPRKRIHVPRTS